MKKKRQRILPCICAVAVALCAAASAGELRLKSGRAVPGDVRHVTCNTVVVQTASQMLFLPAELVDMTPEEWLEKARESFDKKELANAEGLCRQCLALAPDSGDARALMKEIEKAEFERRMKLSASRPPAASPSLSAQTADVAAYFPTALDSAPGENVSSAFLETAMAENSAGVSADGVAELVSDAFSAPTTGDYPMAGATGSALNSPPASGMALRSAGDVRSLGPFAAPRAPLPGPFGILANVGYALAASQAHLSGGPSASSPVMPAPMGQSLMAAPASPSDFSGFAPAPATEPGPAFAPGPMGSIGAMPGQPAAAMPGQAPPPMPAP